MKLRYILSAFATFALCFCMTTANAQCQKSKTSCTKKSSTESTKTLNKESNYVYKSYASCNKYRSMRCGDKKNKVDKAALPMTTLFVLGGLTNNDDQNSFTTGLEVSKNFNSRIGLGLLSEVTFTDELALRFGVPINFYPTRNIKLSGAPLMNMQKGTTTVTSSFDNLPEEKTEWSNSTGARVGISYLINAGGLILAPSARVDFISKETLPSFGLNIGFGL